MHPQVTLRAAQQHIADLHRAADHSRLVHTATTAINSQAVPAPRSAAAWPKRTRWSQALTQGPLAASLHASWPAPDKPRRRRWLPPRR